MVESLRDDPIVARIMATGYPPWIGDDNVEPDENETEVCVTDDGLAYCNWCDNLLDYAPIVEMPTHCPYCQSRLNYRPLRAAFMKGVVLL